MKNLKKVFIIISLIAFSFLISSKQVYAIQYENDNGACYCCGSNVHQCTYSWKTNGNVPSNCAKATNKTQATCHGVNSERGTGACWYCDQGPQGKIYKWTSDGSSPGYNCSIVNGRSQSACKGVPSTDPGSDSGSDSGSDTGEDYEDEETTGPKVSFNTSDASCNGILGSGEFRSILKDFLNIIRILGVALVIIFSTFDFGKALVAQDNDALKKSSQTAFKRLVIAIVIFFVPVLLNILLSLVGISGICI